MSSNLKPSTRYQFNPDLYNPDVVINILIKSLTSAPLPDFNLCISLLDERPINASMEEPDPLPLLLPDLKALHTLLQQCRFPAFWALFLSEQLDSLRDNYTVECVGFEDSVREVVIRAVKAAFTRIGSERLGSYLRLSGSFNVNTDGCESLIHRLQELSLRPMSQNLAGPLNRRSFAFRQTQTTRSSPQLFRKISSCHVCVVCFSFGAS